MDNEVEILKLLLSLFKAGHADDHTHLVDDACYGRLLTAVTMMISLNFSKYKSYGRYRIPRREEERRCYE